MHANQAQGGIAARTTFGKNAVATALPHVTLGRPS